MSLCEIIAPAPQKSIGECGFREICDNLGSNAH